MQCSSAQLINLQTQCKIRKAAYLHFIILIQYALKTVTSPQPTHRDIHPAEKNRKSIRVIYQPNDQSSFVFHLQKKRTESRHLIREPEEYRSPPHHQTTTPYPHPHPQSPDLGGFMQSSSSMSDPYMLSGNIAEVHGGGCEIHMNSFPSSGAAMGIAPAGGAIPLHYGQGQKLPYGLNWLRPVIFCCSTQSLLSRFPSRAKRIDVISRVIFPMVFAVFNLAYWLYYLFAKSKSPQQED